MTAFAVVLELAHRLPLVLALLLFASDPTTGAICATVAGVLSFARALHRGNAYATALADRFSRAVQGIRRASVQHLATLREDREGAHVLVEAAREVAYADAILLPTLVGEGISLGLLAICAVWLLPVGHVIVGAAMAVLFLGVVTLVLRRRRPIERAIWERASETARDTRVLVESAAQLRAQDVEDRFVSTSLPRMLALASLERRLQAEGAIFGVLPLALAGVAALAPESMRRTFQNAGSLAQSGVLGVAVAASAFAVVRAVEAFRRSAPHREAFDALQAAPPGPRRSEIVRAGALGFREVSVVHPGGERATPSVLSFSLDEGGMLLEGGNGTGKSTALLVLLGLLEPTSGRVLVDGKETAARIDAAYVPQRPFWSDGDSLLWHAQLWAREPVGAEEVLRSLARADLADELGARAARLDCHVADLPVGSLSGGERQRFLIAWMLERKRSVIVLDEPEAGLDILARRWLKRELEVAAREARVVVVAHDPAIVPQGFLRVVCLRDEPSTNEQRA